MPSLPLLYFLLVLQSYHDYSMFIKRLPTHTIFLLVYVDDVLIASDNLDAISGAKQFLHDRFRIKDLGVAKYFLCLEVPQTK